MGMDYLTNSDGRHLQYGQLCGTEVDAVVQGFSENALNL